MVVRQSRWGQTVKTTRLTQADYRDFVLRWFYDCHLWYGMLMKKAIGYWKKRRNQKGRMAFYSKIRMVLNTATGTPTEGPS